MSKGRYADKWERLVMTGAQAEACFGPIPPPSVATRPWRVAVMEPIPLGYVRFDPELQPIDDTVHELSIDGPSADDEYLVCGHRRGFVALAHSLMARIPETQIRTSQYAPRGEEVLRARWKDVLACQESSLVKIVVELRFKLTTEILDD